MDSNPNPSNLNGNHPAPLPTSSGAVYSARPAPPTQTAFPDDLGKPSWRVLLYWLGWAQLGEVPLIRWLWVLGILLGIALAIAPIAGKVWLIVLILLALFVLTVARPILARNHFVRFAPTALTASGENTAPAIQTTAHLGTSEKVPVYISGVLEVGGKVRRFVALPGFYRTFATREHALIALCRDHKMLGVGAPPERDLGLWYAFFDAGLINDISVGTVALSATPAPTIRIVYTARHHKQRGEKVAVETLYISTASSETLQRIDADLRHDWHAIPSSALAQQAVQSSV